MYVFINNTRTDMNSSINFMVTPCINEYPTLYCPTNAHNFKKRRVIKIF